MKQLVIMPGGFHPFHAGHLALYQSAEQAFPGADVKVAATNDTSARPFPFKLKEKLAQLAGVPPGKFYQVKSPFRADEITKSYNPADTQLIFVRSEKDAMKPPVAGGIKKDGSPAYLQPISDEMAPMTQHAYMVYLPTVEFGPGMTSATEIRSAWPTLNPKRKSALVMSLYPKTQSNPKLAATVVKMLDTAMGAEAQDVAEGLEQITEYRDRLLQYVKSLLPTWPEYVLKDWLVPNKGDFSNLPDTELKNGIMEKLKGAGLTTNSKWQLVPNMKFTMDMFDPKTKQLLIGRAGGSSDLGMGIPKDKERHATQAALAQQQGGVRKEPVLLIKSANGYELLEGWHRTIQHFVKYPEGYTGPAYVVVAQGPQGVAEGSSKDMSTQDMIAYLRQHHDKNLHQDYLNHLTSTNNKFVLKHIPLISIRTELSGLDRAKVEKYKQMDFAKAPPIVIGSDGNILDGYHRAVAAKELDIPTIKAYVGVKGQQGVDEANASNQSNDSELNAIKNFAKRHYPNLAADPESAFDKWVQRSLMHSNVDDHDMDQKIHRMAAEIADLKTKIQSLKQQPEDSADYLDESR